MYYTRMITFVRAKLKKLDRETNIDKIRVDTHTVLQNTTTEQTFDLLKS